MPTTRHLTISTILRRNTPTICYAQGRNLPIVQRSPGTRTAFSSRHKGKPKASKTPHAQVPLPIQPSLQDALHAGNVVEACDILSKLVGTPSKLSKAIALGSHSALEDSTLQLLKQLLEHQASESGTPPTPLGYIESLKRIGIPVHKHYDGLLFHLLVHEQKESVVLESFEAAMEAATASAKIPSRIFAARPMIYLAYLYLADSSTAADALERLGVEWQQKPDDKKLKAYSQLLPPPLGDRLRRKGDEMALRRILYDHTKLNITIDRFTMGGNDLAGLESFYQSAKSLDPPALNEYSYSTFITAFLRFWRSGDRVLLIWEDMINSGIAPTVVGWNTLLRYGQKHGGEASLLAIWQRMVDSGVTPDVHCWTTRIHSQLLVGNQNSAMDSLRAMLDSGVSPTTGTINAAIDGLIGLGELELASKVMSFADQTGVKADVVTYNTILKGTLKLGSIRTVRSVLENMQARGISPDVFTFTIVLDGLFQPYRNYKPQPSHPDTIETMKLLEFMGTRGIDPNVTTYTAIIYGLVRRRNLAAVSAVRKMMQQRGVLPNSETYTVLIRGAFARGDLEGVRGLLAEIEVLDLSKDHVFWTELILGYAHAGQIQQMETCFREMKREKQRVIIALKGYVTILKALVRQGHMRSAKEIIEDIVSGWADRREASPLVSGGQMEQEFWGVVAKVGGQGWAQGLRNHIATKGRAEMGGR